MKKIIYVLMATTLLAACSSEAEISDPTAVIDLDVMAMDESQPADEITDDALNAQAFAEDGMVVSTPLANAKIESPLTIEGEARGFWYFEGSFIVRLLDPSDNEIGFGTGTATGEWMTEEFVPFEAKLSFDPGDLEGGTLVLENENPSGLAENARRLKVPVTFK